MGVSDSAWGSGKGADRGVAGGGALWT